MSRCKHERVIGWRTNAAARTVHRFECSSLRDAQLMAPSLITCKACDERLSLGPANDSVKPAPLPRREMANFRDADAWSWDISRPIAEQLAETARVDAAASFVATQLAIDQSSADEAEYEASRAAESDCRDEEDEPTWPLGAKDPNEDAMRDPAVTAHNAEAIAQRSLVASPEVCACTGDALRSETCEVEKWRNFDPFGAIVPGDFGGPHGDIP